VDETVTQLIWRGCICSNETTSFEISMANSYKGNFKLIIVIMIHYYNLGELHVLSDTCN